MSTPDLQSRLSAAMEFDPLGFAEDVTGRHHSDDGTALLGLALAMRHSRSKSALLQENNDTHYDISIDGWCAVVESMGFQLLLADDVADTRDKLRVWWKPGVLLVADSYHGDKKINSSNVYFNLRGDRNRLYGGSSSHVGQVDGVDVWAMGFDAREGLRFKLDRAAEAGELLATWVERPFLWLLHYADSRRKGYDHESITAARIARLPGDVQAAINGSQP